MPGPQAAHVELSERERRELERLSRAHGTAQQVALRAQVILDAAAGQSNSAIARQRQVDVQLARRWRERWLGLQAVALDDLSVLERLSDAPRAGRPSTLSAAAVCRIVALACEQPSQSERPLSQWSGRELAAEICKRGIVQQISARHARRLLKKGLCSRTASAIG